MNTFVFREWFNLPLENRRKFSSFLTRMKFKLFHAITAKHLAARRFYSSAFADDVDVRGFSHLALKTAIRESSPIGRGRPSDVAAQATVIIFANCRG